VVVSETRPFNIVKEKKRKECCEKEKMFNVHAPERTNPMW
jgi:hypothetical protein